jgi:SAM-dependent methyltransferase
MEPTGSIRQYGQVFDGIAAEYDALRSGYPPALVDLALERGNLSAGARVLEVGSGTGKLTELLVERHLVVDAVEPGKNMIAAARNRIARNRAGEAARVTFHLGRFEDVELPEGVFDGLFSATAFHWVDPEIGWAKAASHLKPGGLLALLVYTGVRDEATAEIQEELRAIVEKHAPAVVARWRPLRDLETILAGVAERRGNASEVWDWLMSDGRHEMAVPDAAALFDGVQVESDVRIVNETPDEFVAIMRTTSLYLQLEPDRRKALEEDDRRLLEQQGGLRTPIATLLMTARRAQ